MAISPQGYLLGKDPKNVNPFWGENEDASVNRIFATAEITGGTGTPSVQTSKTIDGNNITFGFSFNNLKGEQGEQGARGLQGETGERGPQGLQGEKGEKGDTGERGPQGIQGETGATGPRGEQGETGPRGQQGEQGPQGVQGIQGEQGPQGERGPQGEKGDPGAAFEISKTYASVAAMEADAENVEEGQFVIISSNTEDPDNAKVYVKNAEGGFTFVVDLSGSQGIQGPRGPQGEQGEQGIQGLQGIQGIQGPAGNDGVTPSITATATADSLSSNNPTVTVTKTGTDAQPSFAFAFSGFKGERGEQGLQGIQGIQGETGATGATGPAGANGQGIPTGGTAGQVLAKVDGTDYNTEWVTPQSGGGSAPVIYSGTYRYKPDAVVANAIYSIGSRTSAILDTVVMTPNDGSANQTMRDLTYWTTRGIFIVYVTGSNFATFSPASLSWTTGSSTRNNLYMTFFTPNAAPTGTTVNIYFIKMY